jgi:hypothetical protein
MPTLTGGIGFEELEHFYGDFFLQSNPASLQLTLISRTTGADRVVDELYAVFKHEQDMPWILPGVPPTNKWVEIMLISIVALKGGKLYSERVYWDQASVLVQVGLLSANLVPSKARKRGVERLPVVGKDAARRVLDGFDGEEEGQADNALIPEWDDNFEDDDDDEDGEELEDEDDDQGDEDEDQEEPRKQVTAANVPIRGGKSKGKEMSGANGHAFAKPASVQDE